MKKLLRNVFAFILVGMLSSNAYSAIVTWGIVTDYQGLNGNITFDDTLITGLSDGDYDPNDTHIYNVTINLTSAILGVNDTFTNKFFQPLTNTFDNKHIDSILTLSNNDVLKFWPDSDQGSPAVGVSEYWLYVNGNSAYRWAFTDDSNVNYDTNLNQVPIPAAAFMFAPALLGFMGLRRKAKNTVA
mgnify:CR=1 FL=1